MSDGNDRPIAEPMRLDFESDGVRCASTLYRPAAVTRPTPCLVMAHGFTGTRDQLARYAEIFAAAGLLVLTFDYRHFGDSDGAPRQIVDVTKQLDDWRAALRFVRTLDSVDTHRVALWGSSLSGGYVVALAAEDSTIAAVVAQVPAFDESIRSMLREARYKMASEGISMWALVSVAFRAIVAGTYDAVRGFVHLRPYYMRVFGPPGSVAVFTDPDSDKALRFAASEGPTWRNEFAPRFLFGTPKYVPGTAERVQAPLLVCVAEQDTEADPELAKEIAAKAPRGRLVTYPVRHFEAYTGSVFDRMTTDQTEFLCLALDASPAPMKATPTHGVRSGRFPKSRK